MGAASRISLLDIPPELRLRIYDFVLQPLLEMPEHYDSYVLPDEWPKKRFATYRSLIMSCGTVSSELWPYFERHYFGDITIFFDEAWHALSFVSIVSRSKHRATLGDLHISIRTLNWPRARVDATPHAIKTGRWILDTIPIFTDLVRAEENGAERSSRSALLSVSKDWPVPRSGKCVRIVRTPKTFSSHVTMRLFTGSDLLWTAYGEARAKAKHIDWRRKAPMPVCNPSRVEEAMESLRDFLKPAVDEASASDSEQRQSGQAGARTWKGSME